MSPSLGVQILSFSCSFWSKNWKIIAVLGVGVPSSGKSWIRYCSECSQTICSVICQHLINHLTAGSWAYYTLFSNGSIRVFFRSSHLIRRIEEKYNLETRMHSAWVILSNSSNSSKSGLFGGLGEVVMGLGGGDGVGGGSDGVEGVVMGLGDVVMGLGEVVMGLGNVVMGLGEVVMGLGG